MNLADRIAIQMAPGLLRMAHETAMLAAQSGNAEAFEKANKALDQNLVSASAYDFAEAMLAEREKRRKRGRETNRGPGEGAGASQEQGGAPPGQARPGGASSVR